MLLRYRGLFQREKRDPTVAELFDLANSNSEHSRHHLFRAQFTVTSPWGSGDRVLLKDSLMDLVRKPLEKQLRSRTMKSNSELAFCDNASAISGWETEILVCGTPTRSSPLFMRRVDQCISFTAETHNFPTGIAPFEGAATGTGGRIRDTQAIGRGGVFVAGTAGYCVGAFEGGYELRVDPARYELHSPIDILLRASDGASDYGNKIGEPVVQGFCRSFGGNLNGFEERREWVKPIMFSGGIGHVLRFNLKKNQPQLGNLVVRVGGPTYRLGIGGGAASSRPQQHSGSVAAVDPKLLSAVQRGDAQMENRMDHWVRACIGLGSRNPILSIHDQGAGGMGNVTKEILEPAGGLIDLRNVTRGDQTLSSAEVWVSESQEQNTVLIASENIKLAKDIACRERVPLEVVGVVSNTGRVTVTDETGIVVNLPLKGCEVPRKTYHFENMPQPTSDRLMLKYRYMNSDKDPREWLNHEVKRVLRHPDVCSKRFLTTKVDRSVGGLVAQQQAVGPLHTPLADVAVIAHSHFDHRGAATAIGERPLIGLTDVRAMARMAVAEMLTNMCFAPITRIEDIKCR
jgi:phosphoribosylformylglycinamidine synthase